MANLKPYQVVVILEDPDGNKATVEAGLNTAMERKIYLMGVKSVVRKIDGLEIKNIQENNFRGHCMACGENQIERTYLREGKSEDLIGIIKGAIRGQTRLVVELCESCSKDPKMLRCGYLEDGGGRFVGEEETFGLSLFEDLLRNVS